MNLFVALAAANLFLHLVWCAWVLFGWLLTRGRRVLTWLHIVSLCYAAVIEVLPWQLCPLTLAEDWCEARAGIALPHAPFLVRVLDALVYPDLPAWLVAAAAVVLCVGILGIYVRRHLKNQRRARPAMNLPER